MRDGGSIVYVGEQGPLLSYASRVGIAGDRPPERLELAGSEVYSLAVAPSRDRLAFSRSSEDLNLYRFIPGRPPEPLTGSSSFVEMLSHFSPDGRRIAFDSTRSGERSEVWLSNADGSSPEQLTRGPGRQQGSPYWSPDGRQIVFDSQAEDGRWDIWTTDVAGGTPRRLTQDPGDENVPSFSRDGRWVYFSSDRGGTRDVWRISAGGGTEERVTKGSADFGGIESFDGGFLFFTRSQGHGLFALSLATGAERKLADCVAGFYNFDVAVDGVYYPACSNEGPDSVLHRVDPRTGEDRALGKLEMFTHRLAVSPDGRTIVYTKAVSDGADLMLIENFR